MANYRLIHKEAATGERTTDLDALEFRVWVQYLLSADDFGVCPAVALKLQGDNRRLAKEATRKVQAAIERLIAINLVQVFADKDNRYLYQWDWQDWQRLKHTTTTSLPPIPAEILEKCSPKTRALFRENHSKIEKEFPPHARASDAHANANAHASANTAAEQIRPQPQSGPLIVSPAAWDKTHGPHVDGFCDWCCLPRFLFANFCTTADWDEAQTLAWAKTVRANWPGGSRGDELVFWRARWKERHPQSAAVQGRGEQITAIGKAWAARKDAAS